MTAEQRERVARLRGDGYGYGMIASMLSLPEGTVKSFCRRNGMGGRARREAAGGGEAHACKYCGLPVRQIAGRKEKKFCSYSCRMGWWKEHPEAVDRRAVYEFECANCHRPFSAYGNAGRKYCCHECYIEDRFGGGHGR